MTISNRISLLLVAGFCVLAIVVGMDVREIGYHFLAGALVLVVSFGFYARGWIGGGDAKLAAATALWFGFEWLLPYLLWASIFGGVLTFAILKFRQYPLPAVLNGQAWVDRLHQKDAGVPYGIALAASALLIYPYTVWMKALGL
jgi:prepilin peptidase CpaA